MSIIYTDILKHWTACWQEAVLIGVLFAGGFKWLKPVSNQQKYSVVLPFVDGVFFYFLLYVTLISRTIGSRREVVLLPFESFELLSGEFHYVIENVLLFIPFGFLLYITCYTFGKKCNMKTILLASFLTSVSVEFLQYIFSCGKSETDDVITNVGGAMIGYLIAKLKRV